MKKIYFSLVIALALLGGATQSNAKAETSCKSIVSSKSIVYNLDYTEIVEIDGVKYLVTYNDKGEIIQIDPMD